MTTHPPATEEEAWIAKEREKVIVYLASEQCEHAGVGEWPAFHVDPYVAMWAVQSLTAIGRVGWWAISGDLPTDYMSSSSGYHPRDALRHFSTEWNTTAEAMARGEVNPESKVGNPDQWHQMAPLLKSRAKILKTYADDDSLWQD